MKNHPENLEDINGIEIDGEIREFVSELASDVEEAKSDRSWWENKVDQNRCLRYGIRKPKTKPWPGAANYSLPLIDSDIARQKPSYVNLAYSVSPVVTFVPFGPEDIEAGRNREKVFDWRLRTKVKFFRPYALGIDRMLEQGVTVFKVLWRYETRSFEETIDLEEIDPEVVDTLYDARLTDEDLYDIFQEELRVDLEHDENVEALEKAVEDFRGGATKMDLVLIEVSENRAEVIAVDLREDLVVPQDTIEIDKARFIDYIFPVSINDLKISIRDGKYVEFSDTDIEAWAGKLPEGKNVSSFEDNDDIVWLHETCCWKDINGDGIKERCITTWPDASPEDVLRFIELPFDHGQWPYTDVKRELIDDGFYSSRGLPDLDGDFQRGISTLLNQTIDNGTITNSPQVVYKKNALSNPRNMRYVPGERVEVQTNLRDYELRQSTNVSQPANLQISQYLKGWADQRTGNETAAFSSPQNLQGSGQGGKKTAKEVEAITALGANSKGLDLLIFQDQMARVYHQIDALYDQFGDDEEHILIAGQEPQKVTRQEIQGKFDIVPNGRLDNSTPQLRFQKSFTAFNIFNGDPFIKQRELREFVANDLDDNLSRKIMKSEQEIKAEQQQNAALQEEAENNAIRKQIGLKKISDDLDIRKEALSTPITGRRYAPD